MNIVGRANKKLAGYFYGGSRRRSKVEASEGQATEEDEEGLDELVELVVGR